MLCDQLDDLSQELKGLIFRVLESFQITVPDKNAVKFKRIGMDRGFNSAIHSVVLDDDRTFAIKITNHEVNDIVNMLHNRELEFYEWLESCKRENSSKDHDFSHLLSFYGGTRCGAEPGILILNNLSIRVGIQPIYTIGYQPELVYQIVKHIAAYQSVYLCTDKEISVGKELIKFDLPVQHSKAKLEGNKWMTPEEKRYLMEWTQPENLFAIHTEIPEGVEEIFPVLSHCDLWPGNMLFGQKGNATLLLAFLDWQTFKIGNPLIDIASMIGLNMNTEDRREHTEGIVRLYVTEMEKRKGSFKKPFEMTEEKAHHLLSHALRWACIEIMFAIIFSPIDDPKEEGQELGRLSSRLRELMKDVIGK